MRNVLCLALLVPVLALAAGTNPPGTVVAPGVSLQDVTVLASDGKAGPSNTQVALGPSRAARFTIGTVDTVGGTTYDYCTNGPAYRMLVQTPGVGVHALFMYSLDTDTLFPNRYLRYNFYDYNYDVWSWQDSADFTQSGLNVYQTRTGYGCIDVDTTGVAVVSAHHSTGSGQADYAPIIARDAAVGQGIFDYSPGEPTINNYEWPYISVGSSGVYQLAIIAASNQNNLYWSRSTTWLTWDPAMSIPSPQPEPNFPTHNIAASDVPGSNKVCITWVGTISTGYQQNPGFYRVSSDGGSNWDAPVELGHPPAFNVGSETLPSYVVSSLFPFYDRNDNLHIVGNVSPYVRDTLWILPSQIWHWCDANPESLKWNLIHVASPDSLMGNVPSNSSVSCRPSLGEDESGNLFVAWEEFDGVNVEPTTNRLRADIWYSYSNDHGVTWAEGTKITDGGDVSYRFPSILNPISDTVMVEYLIDQVAGTFVQGAEGPATNNPIVVQKWEDTIPPGAVDGPKTVLPGRMEIAASPVPARGRTVISYSLPRSGDVSLAVYDAAGRPVQVLASGRREAGRYSTTWDARDAAAGVYFYTLTSGKASVTKKLILAD